MRNYAAWRATIRKIFSDGVYLLIFGWLLFELPLLTSTLGSINFKKTLHSIAKDSACIYPVKMFEVISHI